MPHGTTEPEQDQQQQQIEEGRTIARSDFEKNSQINGTGSQIINNDTNAARDSLAQAVSTASSETQTSPRTRTASSPSHHHNVPPPQATARAQEPIEEWDDHLTDAIHEEEERRRQEQQQQQQLQQQEADRVARGSRSLYSGGTSATNTPDTENAGRPSSENARDAHATAAAAGNGYTPSSTLNSADSSSAATPLFAKPSTFLLRPSSSHSQGMSSQPPLSRLGSSSGKAGDAGGQQQKSLPVRTRPLTAAEREQVDGLKAIRAFLKVRTSYDVLPLSYRLIVLDTSLLVKKSLNILTQCGIVSAPLWDSKTSTFAGLLTTSDYLNVVQYYWQNPDALAQIDQFKLTSLRDIERALGVTPIETVSTHPMEPLYEACKRMLQSRARRIPLVDYDDETQRDLVVSVITQYRLLKFICVNVKETQMLRLPLREIALMGTYREVCSARMDTPVIEVIQMLVNRSISSVPILDDDTGAVMNVFEAVDVIMLIKGGDYENLNLTVGRALEKRPEDFPGIYTCTLNDRLDTIFDTVRKSRVHRFVVVDEAKNLVGLLSLSDILNYTLNSDLPAEADDDGQGR